jgi:TolB-like protein/DNA-binding winged helix-turn-helix (wHTH) protein/Tfp pilus assembly protein PilF
MDAAVTWTDTPLDGGFRLGNLQVEPQTGDLTGPAGRMQLDPKVMGVLVVLAEHAGRVVSRDTLNGRMWPDVVVTDDALSRCIYDLRRQLAAAGGNDDYRALIETLSKRGYRLNAVVSPLETPPQPGNASRRGPRAAGWAVALAAIGLLIAFLVMRMDPPTASIAVLPFDDLSETQDQQYFADGLAEEIIDRLNQSTELRIISRTSSFWFRGKDKDIAEIGRKLDVTHVLEGSVRSSGDTLRVTAQLISTADSSHVWSRTLNRKRGELFQIQDEIATAVATSLRTTLDPGEAQETRHPNPAAYDLVKQGESRYSRRAPGDIERSIELFEEATRLDPAYARAWANLAGAYGLQASNSNPRSSLLRARQGQAAHRAVELDPTLAVAHARLAQYYCESGDRESGRKQFAIALELDPDDPQVLGFMAGEALVDGRFDESVDLHRRALLRDPMNSSLRHNFGAALVAAGRFDEALANFRTLAEINPDLTTETNLDESRILTLQGRYDEAASAAMRLPEGVHRDQAIAHLHRAPDHRAAADAALARLEILELAPPLDTPKHTIMNSVRLAEIYAFRGQADRALETLSVTLDSLRQDTKRSIYSWELRNESRLSPFLKPLHDDPRWTALVEQPG